MKTMLVHVQIDKKGKVKFPENVGFPSGEADVIFLFPEGRPHNNLKKFIGCVNDKEAQEIRSIIEEDCERIEQSGW